MNLKLEPNNENNIEHDLVHEMTTHIPRRDWWDIKDELLPEVDNYTQIYHDLVAHMHNELRKHINQKTHQNHNQTKGNQS